MAMSVRTVEINLCGIFIAHREGRCYKGRSTNPSEDRDTADLKVRNKKTE